MNFDRRKLIVAASLTGLASLSGTRMFGAAGEKNKLYRTAEPATILAATRELIVEDSITTLITIDVNGQPRARSVLVSTPDDDLSLWIGTRRGSRKLDQIAANPMATLHFNNDAKGSYLSLMGEAHRQTDVETISRNNPYKGDQLEQYFPSYPEDFALISFKPHWLEIMTATLPGMRETWQPQGIELR